MNSILGWIVAILVFGVLVATDSSYENAKMEAEHYTDMVCNGYWPDYEERNPDCSFSVEAD